MEWNDVDRKIARIFPGVKFVSTENLLAQKKLRDKPAMIDVRLPEEYCVSCVPKFRDLQSTSPIVAAVLGYAESIVLYCSVGFRSACVAKTSGIRLFSRQSAGLPYKTQLAACLKFIHKIARGAFWFSESCMPIHLNYLASGKLFSPALRHTLYKPGSSDANK